MGGSGTQSIHVYCCFFALEFQRLACALAYRLGRRSMQKLAVAMALIVVSLSLAGCFVGKGKGKAPPPPPVVTKG